MFSKFLISAEWDSEVSEAKVVKNAGSSLNVFGHSRNRCVYLYPEETLYLVEMVYRSFIVLFQPFPDMIDYFACLKFVLE